MSRNRWARIARQAMTKFNIRYTTALQSCRDIHSNPAFEDRMDAHRKSGLSYGDSMLAMIDEDFEFFDEEPEEQKALA